MRVVEKMYSIIKYFVLIVINLNLLRAHDYRTDEDLEYQTNSRSYEHPGGVIDNKEVFSFLNSPYTIQNDIIIDNGGELSIEPGVTINFQPQVGITVRGVLIAKVSLNIIKIMNPFIDKSYIVTIVWFPMS